MFYLHIWALVVTALLARLQAVSAWSFKFDFKDPVRQCKPVSLKFEQGDNAKISPTALTLLPFGGKAVQIPIPPEAVQASGVDITFLPLAANTTFLASLDDDNGTSARVSDVIMVMDSDDSSCLSQTQTQAPFTLPDSLSQCENFTVDFTTEEPPEVRVFFPAGSSFKLQTSNVTELTSTNKTAIYELLSIHGFQVALSASTSNNLADGWVSTLMTVQGHAFSPSSCFKNSTLFSNNGKGNGHKDKGSKVPLGVVIGLSVGGGVIFVIAAVMATYLIYQRRQKKIRASGLLGTRRQGSFVEFDSEKPPPSIPNYARYSQSPAPYASAFGAAKSFNTTATDVYVVNPAYTRDTYTPSDDEFSIIETTRRRGRDSSFSRRSSIGRQSQDQRASESETRQNQTTDRQQESSQESLGRQNMMSYDIERMLTMAADVERNPSQKTIDTSKPTSPIHKREGSKVTETGIPIIREPRPPSHAMVAARAAASSPSPSWWTTDKRSSTTRPYPSSVPKANMGATNFTTSPMTAYPGNEVNPFHDSIPIRFSQSNLRKTETSVTGTDLDASRYSQESNVLPPLSRENTLLRPPLPNTPLPNQPDHQRKPSSRFSDPSLISNGGVGVQPDSPERPPRSPVEQGNSSGYRGSVSSWGPSIEAR